MSVQVPEVIHAGDDGNDPEYIDWGILALERQANRVDPQRIGSLVMQGDYLPDDFKL